MGSQEPLEPMLTEPLSGQQLQKLVRINHNNFFRQPYNHDDEKLVCFQIASGTVLVKLGASNSSLLLIFDPCCNL